LVSEQSAWGTGAAIGSTLIFAANDGDNGVELWKSDGTSSGTVMVKDINSGSNYYGNALPTHSLTAIGTTVFFAANDGDNGTELWKSDGTSSGTMLVKDIRSGSDSSSPRNFFKVGSTLYFTADDGISGEELWKSDGSTEGTVLVKDINNGSAGSFSWRYPTSIGIDGSMFYFSAEDDSHGRELWKTDGTAEGTELVADINNGSGSSTPSHLVLLGTTLYFSASDGSLGKEMWAFETTNQSFWLVADIFSGSGSSEPDGLTEWEDTLYFGANDGIHGRELWKSDGSSAGTMITEEIYVGEEDGLKWCCQPLDWENYHYMFFRADDGVHGQELWRLAN
jgi:ELWxxDGT repeat protein